MRYDALASPPLNGDYGYAELGKPSNADLVKKVADIARAVGREVATPDQAREMHAIK